MDKGIFRIIAVDDEKIALERFERIIAGEERVRLVGKFHQPDDAVEFVKNNPVDIAFLDIEMPGMDGLELSKKLSAGNPGMETIFITAYDSYALRAFQAHAVGYLLKPVDITDITGQIDNLIKKMRLVNDKSQAGVLKVKCFGEFFCRPGLGVGEPMKWRTSKAEELFALLINNRGRPLLRDVIIEELWPDTVADKAANNFRVTCTYLRNTLAEKGFEDMLKRERDSYSINIGEISCDLFIFDYVSERRASAETKELEDASLLYEGRYLGDKQYEWANKPRLWLENEFKNIQFTLSERYKDMGDLRKACIPLERVLKHDPFEEEAIENLIRLKLLMGESLPAKKV
ncbi:MAG: response regulator, partial [Clostridiales bacterium]|nr:response regulator [Clostridiales bacterium]